MLSYWRAEINLLLIAMLRHEHIEADPVILSTRDTTVFVYNGENNHMDITYSEKQDFRSHKLAKDLPSEVAVDMAYKRMNLRRRSITICDLTFPLVIRYTFPLC